MSVSKNYFVYVYLQLEIVDIISSYVFCICYA